MKNSEQKVTILSILESKESIPLKNTSGNQFVSYTLINQDIERRDSIIDNFQDELSTVANAIDKEGNIVIRVASILNNDNIISDYNLKYDFDISRTGQVQINIYISLKESSTTSIPNPTKPLSINLYEIKFLSKIDESNKVDLSNIELVEIFIVDDLNEITTAGRSLIVDIET